MDGKRNATMCVLKVLEKYSDEKHYLTSVDISKLVMQEFGLDIGKKSIAASIHDLEKFDYGIDTIHRKGTALLNRTIEKSEAQFLVDALYSSRILEEKQASELAKKVVEGLSIYDRNDLSNLHKTSEFNKSDNKQLFYNISIISEAISEKVQIKFHYQKYELDKTKSSKYFHYVTPYFLVNNFGKYYVVCKKWRKNQKDNTSTVYRLDKIVDIELHKKYKGDPIETVSDFEHPFSIDKYISEHVYLFGGPSVDAIIRLKDDEAIDYVYDWFYDTATSFKKDGQNYVKIKANESSLFYWALQYGNSIEVVSPQNLRTKIKESLINQLKYYE